MRIVDTLSDNVRSGRLVLGLHRRVASGIDLANINAVLYSGYLHPEVEMCRGSSVGTVGNPGRTVAWLARTAARFDVGLEAGYTILSGPCTKPVDVALLRPGSAHPQPQIAHGWSG
jgi:2-keto-4-pentenoate hydratase